VPLLLQLMPAIIPKSHTNNAQIKRNKQNQRVEGSGITGSRVGDYALKNEQTAGEITFL